MKIVIIGSGNVATHIGKALQKTGNKILQVYSRSKISAKTLSGKLSCAFTTEIAGIVTHADFYVIALSDEAIKPFLEKFSMDDQVIVHTSGSVSISVFEKQFKNYGVIYPVQTFSMSRKINFKKVPVCIEASNQASKKKISTLVKTLTNHVHYFDSGQRKVIHLAAVFANNFSNHLYTIAENLLQREQISFDILRSLISESALKVQHESPAEMQTGPAKRGDTKVLEEHLKMLRHKKKYSEIYKLISDSISETSGIRL